MQKQEPHSWENCPQILTKATHHHIMWKKRQNKTLSQFPTPTISNSQTTPKTHISKNWVLSKPKSTNLKNIYQQRIPKIKIPLLLKKTHQNPFLITNKQSQHYKNPPNSSNKPIKTKSKKIRKKRGIAKNPPEDPKIGDRARQSEDLLIISRRHGGVDADETDGEDEEDAHGGGYFPLRQREPTLKPRTPCLLRRRRIFLGALQVSLPPDLDGHIPRSGHHHRQKPTFISLQKP